MKCPKCGGSNVYIRDFEVGEQPMYRCPSARGEGCGHEWPYVPPLVKRAFAACKRALTHRDSNKQRFDGRFVSDVYADAAMRAIARAEGKESKR